MSFWRRLFGKVTAESAESSGASFFQSTAATAQPPAQSPPAAPRPPAREVDWSGCFDLGFPGPDGTYLARARSNTPLSIGTGRISRSGRFAIAWGGDDYVLFTDARVVFGGKRRGIVDGDIDDAGRYVLGTGTAGEKRLHGKALVFNPDHTLILEDSYGAMVFNVAISPDGRYAVCQTCNGNSRGGLLSVYDLEARSRLLQEETGSHWASSYAFDCQEHVLTLRFQNAAEERIALDGRQIPRYAVPVGRSGPSPCSANPYDDFWAAEGAFLKLPDEGAVPPEVLTTIRDGFRRALTGEMTDRKRAEAYRRLGEIALRMEDPQLAIKCWKSAVAWLPGIGVAKKLKELERLHSSPLPAQRQTSQ